MLFGVMKLSTHVIGVDANGNEVKIRMEGVAGFIPVFPTLAEAEAEAMGKYKIFAIKSTGIPGGESALSPGGGGPTAGFA